MTKRTVNFSISPVVAKTVKQTQVVAKVTGKTVKSNVPEKTAIVGNIPDSLSVTGQVTQNAAGDASSRGMYLPEHLLGYSSVKLSAQLSKTDTQQISEVITSFTEKALKDFPVTSDNVAFYLSSKIGDSLQQHESIKINTSLVKHDLVVPSEVLDKAIGFGVKTVGSVETLSKAAQSTKTEVYSISDVLALAIVKPLKDSLSSEDTVSKHVYLHFVEVIAASDTAEVIVVPELRGDFEETPSITESLAIVANAFTNNAAGAVDQVTLSVSKPLYDNSVTNDNVVILVNLNKKDVVGSTEFLSKILEKSALFSASTATNTGRAVVQSYYASDFYWEDFHGTSYNSLE